MFTRVPACFLLLLYLYSGQCTDQYGPDPWHSKSKHQNDNHHKVPPDLKLTTRNQNTEIRPGEWFFKRLLAVILKSGYLKENEDMTVDVSVQLKLPREQWDMLQTYISSNNAFTDEMYRRSLGYISDGIYKPTIKEQIAMAWSEYVVHYLQLYKREITWSCSAIAGVASVMYMLKYMSRKVVLTMFCLGLYLYETMISYMEADKQEYGKFVSRLKQCQWHFWSSECDLPLPDPLVFLKHMHPMKIILRIFTMFISEPMVMISSTVQTICHGITGELIYPLNIIFNGILLIFFNGMIILLLVMVMFNFVLNIPINMGLFGNLINIGFHRTKRIFHYEEPENHEIGQAGHGDRLSGRNIEGLINIMQKMVDNKTAVARNETIGHAAATKAIKRSASAGRITDVSQEQNSEPGTSRGIQKPAIFNIGDGDK